MRASLFILLIFQVQANGACIDQLVKPEQLACVQASKNFAQINSLLCANNNRDFSAKYQTYLKHKNDWNETFEKWKALPTGASEKMALKMRLDSIQRDWRIYGFRDEVEYAQALIDVAGRQCPPK